MPDDYIIREGEQGDCLYFVNKGEVQVTVKNSVTKLQETIGFLRDGVVFGEIALLTKLKRTATVVSKDYSNCAFLEKDDVE